MFDKLEETFDLIPAETQLPAHQVYDADPEDEPDDKVESTLIDLIDQSMDALKGLTRVAESSEHPRAYEATATLVQTIADVVTKLDAIKQRKVKPGAADAAPGTVNQNLFVGSTEDMLELLEKLDKRN